MNLVPHKLALKLILSLTIIVALAEGISGYLNHKNQEHQLLEAMIVGADQLSKSITSATWHAMLADHRESAYQTMQTIALKQGIKRIRIFNKGRSSSRLRIRNSSRATVWLRWASSPPALRMKSTTRFRACSISPC